MSSAAQRWRLRSVIAVAVIVAIAVPVLSKVGASLPRPYRDGCSGGRSMFYRHVLNRVPEWEGCCDAHDKIYGPGGTSDQRVAADRGLYECVAATDNRATALVMWVAVRAGGTPAFPFGWRWGFERDYGATWWYEHHTPDDW